MINEQDKQRIESESDIAAKHAYIHKTSAQLGYRKGYIAGATAELERSEKLLQQANDMVNSARSYTEGAEIKPGPILDNGTMQDKIRDLQRENFDIKQSLRELIDIIEEGEYDEPLIRSEKAAIDRAKSKLI